MEKRKDGLKGRWLAVLLAVVFLAGMLPASAFATEALAADGDSSIVEELQQADSLGQVAGGPTVQNTGGGLPQGDGPTAAVEASLAVDSSFRTYTSKDGALPGELAVTVNLTTTRDAGVTGVYALLDTTGIQSGYDGLASYFTYMNHTNENNNLIESVVQQAGNIRINLKDGVGNASDTVTLYFAFHPGYNAKVLPGDLLWQAPTLTVRDQQEQLLSIVGGDVVGSSQAEIDVRLLHYLPEDGTASPGDISAFEARLYNYSYYQTELVYPVTMALHFPAGTTFTGNTSGLVESTENGHPVLTRTISSYQDWNVRDQDNNPDTGTWDERTISFILPDSMNDGETFFIDCVIEYRYIGGTTQRIEKSLEYTVKEKAQWDFSHPNRHNNGGSTAAWHSASNTVEGSISNTYTVALGISNYTNATTTRNQGRKDVTNMEFILHQPTGEEKLNYESIRVDVLADEVTSNWFKIEYYYVIEHYNTGAQRQTDPKFFESSTASTGLFTYIDLPTLQAGEYIKEVHVVPYSTEGIRGALSPSRAFTVYYSSKTWPEQIWPSGNRMPDFSVVDMYYTLGYDKCESNGDFIEHVTDTSVPYQWRYAREGVYAYAKMVATDPAQNNVQAGETVQFEIQGYNDTRYSVDKWKNPAVIVKTPASLTIAAGFETELEDIPSGQKRGVQITQLADDGDGNHVYLFRTTGEYAAAISGDAQFRIPVTFSVAAGTPAGEYRFPQVWVGSTNDYFQMVDDSQLPLSGTEFGEYAGLGLLSTNIALATELAHDSYTVGRTVRLSYAAFVKGLLTPGQTWAEAQSGVPVPVSAAGEDVQLKLVLTNSGNAAIHNITLYNIFPYNGYLGSVLPGNGKAEIVSVQAAEGGSLRYTNGPTSLVEDDIGGLDFSDGSWQGSLQADSTAVFFNYGENTLQPASSIEIVITLRVPAAQNDEYTVVDQFSYTGRAEGAERATTYTSGKYVLNNGSFTVSYDENLPASAGGTAMGIPGVQTYDLQLTNGSVTDIQLAAGSPTLNGYLFLGWNTQADGSGEAYAPADILRDEHGSPLVVNTAGNITLYAQWQANPVTVTYHPNGGAGAETPFTFPHTEPHQVRTDNDLGYSYGVREFLGWSEDKNAQQPDSAYTPGVNITPADNITLYAIWSAAPEYPDKVLITKTAVVDEDGKKYVKPDTGFVYELLLDNTHNSMDVTVTVTDTLPVGLSYQEGTTSPTPTSVVEGANGTTIVWENVAVTGGKTRTLTLGVWVEEELADGTKLKNVVTAVTNGVEEGEDPKDEDEETVTVIDPEPEPEYPDKVLITKTAVVDEDGDGKKYVKPDTGLVYELLLDNTHNSMDVTVTVTDTLPVGLTYQEGTTSPAPTSVVEGTNGTTIVWENVTVTGGKTRTLTLGVWVEEELADGTALKNVVTAVTNGVEEGKDPKDEDEETVTVTDPGPEPEYPDKVLITKTAAVDEDGDGKKYVKPDTGLVYELLLDNTHNSMDVTVTVTDTLPVGLSYRANATSPAPTSVVEGANGTTIVWENVTVTGGKTRTLTLGVWVEEELADGTALKNVVTAVTNGVEEGKDPKDEDEETVTVTDPGPEPEYPDKVLITKTAVVEENKDGNKYVKPDTGFVYELLLDNTHNSMDVTVTVTDTLPVGLSYRATTTSPVPAKVVEGTNGTTLVWENVTVKAGETRTLTLGVWVQEGLADATKLKNVVTAVTNGVEESEDPEDEDDETVVVTDPDPDPSGGKSSSEQGKSTTSQSTTTGKPGSSSSSSRPVSQSSTSQASSGGEQPTTSEEGGVPGPGPSSSSRVVTPTSRTSSSGSSTSSGSTSRASSRTSSSSSPSSGGVSSTDSGSAPSQSPSAAISDPPGGTDNATSRGGLFSAGGDLGRDATREELVEATGALTLFDNDIPLGSFALKGGWSLVSLLFSILSLLGGVVMFVRLLTNKKQEEAQEYDEDGEPLENEEEEQPTRYKTRRVRLLFACISGIVPLLLFFILDNLRSPMVLLNRWTPLILLFALVHLVLVILQAILRKERPDEEIEEA